MLTVQELKSNPENGTAGALAQYFGAGATAYYCDSAGDEKSTSQWFGKGAAHLGLSGRVDEDVFTDLLWGIGPKGESLRQHAGEKPQWVAAKNRDGTPKLDENGDPMGHFREERIGYDFCFSPDKTVSNAWAIGAVSDDLKERQIAEAIHKAHEHAVLRQLTFLEDYAETRRGNTGSADTTEYHRGEGLVIGVFHHFTARGHDKHPAGVEEDEDTIDEQLHTHCVIQNMCLAQGRFTSLEAGEMIGLQRTCGAMYRSDLAKSLQEMGLTLDFTEQLDKHGKVIEGAFKIVGISDEYRTEKSGRRQQINEFMEANPGASSQEANLATRHDKKEPKFQQLLVDWKESQDDFRRRHPELNLPTRLSDLIGLAPSQEEQLRRQDRARQTQEEFDNEVLDKLHENQSVFRKRDLLRVIAEKTTGNLDAKGVIGLANAFLARQEDLAVINPEQVHEDDRALKPSMRYTEHRFASKSRVLDMEKDLAEGAKARVNETHGRLDPRIVDQCIADFQKKRGFAITAEQAAAVRHVTQETGGVAVIRGAPGSGKTTSSEVTVEAYRKSGFKILGAATGWDAAKKLQAETDVESHSISSILHQLDKGPKSKIHLDSSTLLIVDEAGMIGTRSLQRLMSYANKAGSKVVLQGDQLQLQSVEAGAGMRTVADAIGMVELKEIRRQKHQSGIDIATKFSEAGGAEKRSRAENLRKGREIMLDMEKAGHLVDHEERQEVIRDLVSTYIADPRPARNKVILGGTHKDLEEITALLRTELRAAGQLGDDKQVVTKTPRAEHPVKLDLAVGDRIRFASKDKELDVVNGTVAVVTGLIPGKDGKAQIEARIESTIKKQDGRTVHFRSDQVSFDLGWASTVHRSQGQSLDSVFHLHNPKSVDRQLAMVGYTRHKEHYTLFMQTKDKDNLHRDAQVVTDRLQVNALEEGVAFGGRSTKDLIAEHRAKKAQAQAEAQKTPKLDADAVTKAAEAFKRIRDHVPPTLAEAVRRSQGQGRGRGQGL